MTETVSVIRSFEVFAHFAFCASCLIFLATRFTEQDLPPRQPRMPIGDVCAVQPLTAVVVAVIGAVMTVHVFVRVERLVGDVSLSDPRRHRPRRDIKCSAEAGATWPGVVVVKQVRLAIEAIEAFAVGAGAAAQPRPAPIADVGRYA